MSINFAENSHAIIVFKTFSTDLMRLAVKLKHVLACNNRDLLQLYICVENTVLHSRAFCRTSISGKKDKKFNIARHIIRIGT